jgi:hypothetical protein
VNMDETKEKRGVPNNLNNSDSVGNGNGSVFNSPVKAAQDGSGDTVNADGQPVQQAHEDDEQEDEEDDDEEDDFEMRIVPDDNSTCKSLLP